MFCYMKKIKYEVLTENVFKGENNKYYYFYCITNQVSGRKYWGVHSTLKLDDGYRGSGRELLKEMKTTPISNYYKEIIKFFNNEEEMYKYEEKVVTSEVVKDKNTYNLHTGGSGSWDFTTGRVTVRNADGSCMLVDKDDERYINGTLKHNMVGLVHVIDKEGKHVTINQETYYNNPDLYKVHIYGKVLVRENGVKKWMDKNEYELKKDGHNVVGMTKGMGVFKDKSGKRISCAVNDPRVLSGELVGSTTGLGAYKYRNDFSKTCQTTPDDPRVLSGELVGVNYGLIHCINPITLEKVTVEKGDERLETGELVSVAKFRSMKLQEQGIKLTNNKQIMTKDDYYQKYGEIIDLLKCNTPRREIAQKTNLTLKKIRYIWDRYRKAQDKCN